MAVRFIRINELATTPGKPGRWPVSKQTIFRWIREGKLPSPTKLGGHLNAWEETQIQSFEAQGSSGFPRHQGEAAAA